MFELMVNKLKQSVKHWFFLLQWGHLKNSDLVVLTFLLPLSALSTLLKSVSRSITCCKSICNLETFYIEDFFCRAPLYSLCRRPILECLYALGSTAASTEYELQTYINRLMPTHQLNSLSHDLL